MKNLNYLNKYRQDVRHIYGTNGDEYNGAFKIYVNGRSFFVIASNVGAPDRRRRVGTRQRHAMQPETENLSDLGRNVCDQGYVLRRRRMGRRISPFKIRLCE